MLRRTVGIFVAVALVTLALAAASARADIGVISVRPVHARPGEVVTVVAGAYKAVPRMPLYLVPRARVRPPHPCGPNALCDTVLARPPRHAPYLLAGLLDFRRHPRRVVVRFRLPRLSPGVYEFLIYCDLCHRGPGGTLISNPSAIIHVEPSDTGR
jgi:hypothetical protein